MKRLMMVAALVVFGLAALAGGAGTDQDLRALTRKVERLEKDVRDLTKTVRALDKALVIVSKEASTARKVLKALDDRSTERELLLAEWFDRYHAKSDGRFHRGVIRRVK